MTTAPGTAPQAPLELYDTTLRDGAQAPGISFSVSDKLGITERLDELGMTYIEGGWPGANPTDTAYFQEMQRVTLRRARLVAFGATRRPNSRAEDDDGLRQLLNAATPAVALVGKSWRAQVEDVIRTTADENLRMIADSVAFLLAQGREVIFDAEHFFDGYAADPEYAVRCLAAAAHAGAHRLVLCDTNGGTLPHDLEAIVRVMAEEFGDVLGVHCHDDSGVAVANTLAAVRAGVVHVQGCLNGYGERSGNANLGAVIANLQLKMGHALIPTGRLRELTAISRYIDEMANVAPNTSAPYVGEGSFTHKGGQHVDAMTKAAYTYQHVDPSIVGNRTRIVVSDQSGRSNVVQKAGEMGLDLQNEPGLARRVASEIKDLEFRGYSFEGAEASFAMVIRRAQGHSAAFELVDATTVISQRPGTDPTSEATVTVRVAGAEVTTTAAGDGPVNALDRALRAALSPAYPDIGTITLHDYKVRVLTGREGTAAPVRVLIESGNHEERWRTVGCSTNIIEASWLALADAFEHGLITASDARRSRAFEPAR